MAGQALKQPVDLYLSLAFAAADVLFELEPDGRIVHAVGEAMPVLGRPARLLTDQSILDIVAPHDRDRMARALAAMARGEHLRNLPFAIDRPEMEPAHVSLSGYGNPARGGKLAAAMAYTPGALPPVPKRTTPSGLLDKDSFEARARDLLGTVGAENSAYRLTLLEVTGMAALRAALGADATEILVGALGEKLRSLSACCDAAGQLSDSKYGIVHTATIDPDAIARAVAEAADRYPGAALPAKTATLILDVAELPADVAARALAYTLNAFTSASEGVSLDSMAGTLRPRLSRVAGDMTAVRRVIEDGAFHMVYQPIVDLRTNAIHHFECLVRFQDSGDRSPYDTVTFAEDTGLIGELDLEVLRRVIAVMRGPAGSDPALRFAVNLSGRSLADHRVTGRIRGLLRASPHLAGRLLFEITESAVITDLAAANAVVQEIRRMGFQVCLDDFGAGSAAFHYLRALKVDHVKIDGSYIRDCVDNTESAAFIKSMVGLCTDLGITTIAEYVESAPIAAMLKEMKVRYGQGWHFGKPDALSAWAP